MHNVPAPFQLPRSGLPRVPPSAELQRRGGPVQMRAAVTPPHQVIQRTAVQDLGGYAIKSPRVRLALSEIQVVLSDPARVRHWADWL